VPAFVVIGGGVYGAYVVRQLRRAVCAGRLETEQMVVVDRDPRCAVAGHQDPRVHLEVADWEAWLDGRLPAFPPDAHIVPYHWAPHLFLDWLARRAREAGARACRGEAPSPPAGVPFARASRQGDLALSYATWSCPATCIEPDLCPHTQGPKDWSLCGDLENLPEGADEAVVFRCLHLVYGVGTVPVSALLAARDRVLAGLRRGRRRYLVATSSHCHALAATLEVERLADERRARGRAGPPRAPQIAG
jgi:hypothetical protein